MTKYCNIRVDILYLMDSFYCGGNMEHFKLRWFCQTCGKEVRETLESEEEAISRSEELDFESTLYERVCDECKIKDRIRPKCDMCGACCAYPFYIQTYPDDCGVIREGHLYDFDGIDGYLKKTTKKWSKPYQVCIFLKEGVGCPLDGDPLQPRDCIDFNCKLPPWNDKKRYKKFHAFRKKWIKEGMHKKIKK
jgi:hypothetical protein